MYAGGLITTGRCQRQMGLLYKQNRCCTTQALAPLQALRLCVNVCTPCMCDHVLQRSVWLLFSVLLVSAVSIFMEFICYGTSQQTTVTPDHLAFKPQHPHGIMCRSNPNFSLLTSPCACVDGWLYPGREIATPHQHQLKLNPNHIQPSPGNPAKLNSR